MAVAMFIAMPAKSAPTTVYSGTANGVIVSTDGGGAWTTLLSGVPVTALAIDPLNPEVIYAGASEAVYKTTNGGAHWTKETNGLSSVNITTSLQIDPADPNIIYLGSGGGAFGSGVFKSTDGGVHWTAMNNGLVTNGILSVQALALDALSPNTLYLAGITGLEPSKTTNGAASWTSVNLPTGFAFGAAINPVNDSVVFMSGPFGFFKSTNAGTSWTSPLPGFFQAIAIDPNTASTMYTAVADCVGCSSAIYQSLDTGTTWNQIGALAPTGEGVHALAIDPANSSTLYAAGNTGVWQSTNSGASWTLVEPVTGGTNTVVTAPNALQTATFDLFETLAQAAIAVANDFKSDPTIACGILRDYLNQIPGLVSAGLLSSEQGQALTLQVQNAEASIPCS